MFCEESLGKINKCELELFRNGSVREFYLLKELITLVQVNTSVVDDDWNAMFSSQCNFSPIKALEFSCNYTRVQPATADVSPVLSNTLLRDGPFSFLWGGGGGRKGLGTYQIKVLHKKFKRKKYHAQESTWKKNSTMPARWICIWTWRYLKIQELIDPESQEQTFIIIPPRLLK